MYPEYKEKLNEIVKLYYDGKITADTLAMFVSYIVNLDDVAR